MKFLLGCLVLALAASAQASKGMNISDEILFDFREAKTCKDFVIKTASKSLPGDREYVEALYKSNHGLSKDNTLPKMNFENGVFTLREGRTVTAIHFSGKDHYQFEINSHEVALSPWDHPSVRYHKIVGALKEARTAHWSLMPVAWADGSEVSSKTAVLTLAISGALLTDDLQMHYGTRYGLIRSGKFLNYDQAQEDLGTNYQGTSCAKDLSGVLKTLKNQSVPLQGLECQSGNLTLSFQSEDSLNAIQVTAQKALKMGTMKKKFDSKASCEIREVDLATESSSDPTFLKSSPATRQASGGEYGCDRESPETTESLQRFRSVATAPGISSFCGGCHDFLVQFTSSSVRKAKTGARKGTDNN